MDDLIDFLIKEGKSWVLSQRNLYRNTGKKLAPFQIDSLSPYFHKQTLDIVRINEVSQIENPSFFSVFLDAGQEIPIDMRSMAGITLVDTVVAVKPWLRSPYSLSLLFHECVHVCQYRILGIDRFFEEYIKGWAQNGFDYYSIPIETEAYELEHLFSASSDRPFSVEADVKRRHSVENY